MLNDDLQADHLRQHAHAGGDLGRHQRAGQHQPLWPDRKFAELFAKYGTDKVLDCWREWMDICERELRKEIAKVPDGLYGPETDYLDDDGIDLDKPHRISASLEVKGDTPALHP